MDLRGFTACAIIALCLIKQSDAAITQWQGTQADGSTAIPTFPAGADAIAGSAIELAEGTTGTLFTLTATADAGTVTYAFVPTTGNPSTIADNTISADGVVSLASGSMLDYETTTSYVFLIVATSSSATTDTGTATLTLSITDRTLWTQTSYVACLSSTSMAAGASIGTYASTDATSTQTVAFTATGGTDHTKFAIDSSTGALTVAASNTLETTTKYVYIVELTATITGVLAEVATVYVALACSSGAGQITALLGVLLMSVLPSLFC